MPNKCVWIQILSTNFETIIVEGSITCSLTLQNWFLCPISHNQKSYEKFNSTIKFWWHDIHHSTFLSHLYSAQKQLSQKHPCNIKLSMTSWEWHMHTWDHSSTHPTEDPSKPQNLILGTTKSKKPISTHPV